MKTFINLASVAAVTLAASAAQGAIVQYVASLNGSSVSPPNSSPATGSATFDFDTTTHLLTMTVNFSGLVGTTISASIHGNTADAGTGLAGVATGLTSWTTGLNSGTYTSTVNMLSTATYGNVYLAAHGGTAASAETDLLAAMTTGYAYLIIRSTTYPGGEIRGFIYQVPAPGMLPLLAMGGLLARRRRN